MFWVSLGLNSLLAYLVNLTNFMVTRHTSALTLQACPCSVAQRSTHPATVPCRPQRVTARHSAAWRRLPRAQPERRPCPPYSAHPANAQVLGNAKGVVASAVSVALFKNPVTSTGALGYAITVAGVVMYSQVCAVLAGVVLYSPGVVLHSQVCARRRRAPAATCVRSQRYVLANVGRARSVALAGAARPPLLPSLTLTFPCTSPTSHTWTHTGREAG